jgi:CelD/BcsL family acetyltransferase involved in cellulose biosynthesis
MGGALERLTSRSIVYGSVLCDPGPEGSESLAALLKSYEQAIKKNVLFTELRNISNTAPLQPVLQSAGFAYEEHINYLIDLDCTKKELMERLGKRTRKHIRRALRKEEMVVEEATCVDQVKACYNLLEKTYRRAGVFLADYSLFEAAFHVLYPKGMVRFLLVRIEDNYAASSVELLFKDTVYGWFSGLDRSFQRYNPNEFLMWHILEWAIDKGYRRYDFGGAGDPDEEYGVRDFKAKFKGDLVSYGRNIYVHAPLRLRMSKLGYKAYQKILSARSPKGASTATEEQSDMEKE